MHELVKRLSLIISLMCLVKSEQQRDDRHKQRPNFHIAISQLLYEKVSCWYLHHHSSNRCRCTRYWLHTLSEQTDLISSLAKWQCRQSVVHIWFENQIGFVCSVNKGFKLRRIIHHSIWFQPFCFKMNLLWKICSSCFLADCLINIF